MFKFRTLLRHATRRALSFAAESADNNNAARMPMMAMTTSNSMSVKALLDGVAGFICSPDWSGFVARSPPE
jgi:hypothetical protein